MTPRTSRRIWPAGLALAFGACTSTPPPPDWQLDAQGAIERAIAAYLRGDARTEQLEAARSRDAAASTGQPTLVARIELMRCAARVASLQFEPCAAFEALRADVAEPERAYADYLAAASITPAQAALLPPAQRAAATAPAESAAQALRAIEAPLSRLVAAGVMFESGRAEPAVIALAADTAASQGWRRPLLAWLGVQRERAERAGDAAEAQRLQRRIGLVEGGG